MVVLPTRLQGEAPRLSGGRDLTDQAGQDPLQAQAVAAQPDLAAVDLELRAGFGRQLLLKGLEKVARQHVAQQQGLRPQRFVGLVQGLQLIAEPLALLGDDAVEGLPARVVQVRVLDHRLDRGPQVGQRAPEALGGAAQQKVALGEACPFPAGLGEHHDVAARGALGIADQCHPAVQEALGRLDRAQQLGGLGLARRALGRGAPAQAAEGVADRFPADQFEDRAAQSGGFRGRQGKLRGLVVEQDLVIEVADHDRLAEVAQDRLQPAALLVAAGAGAGHRLDHLAACRAQLPADLLDGLVQRAQGVGFADLDARLGPRPADRVEPAGQARQGANQALLDDRPGDRRGRDQAEGQNGAEEQDRPEGFRALGAEGDEGEAGEAEDRAQPQDTEGEEDQNQETACGHPPVGS